MNEQQSSPREQIPSELYDHLRDKHVNSFEFQQDFKLLNQLAAETGAAALMLEDIFPPAILTPPEGFSSEIVIKNGSDLPVEQFKGLIYSFSILNQKDLLTLDVHRLVTDKNEIRICDLRPFMTAQVRKGGPKDERLKQRLDNAVYNDIKNLADTGEFRRKVKGTSRIGYTRLGDRLERAYWMVVHDNNADGIPTVARIADSVTKPEEELLYRRVFNKKLSR